MEAKASRSLCIPCRTCRRLAFSGSAAPDLWMLTGGSRVQPHFSFVSSQPLLRFKIDLHGNACPCQVVCIYVWPPCRDGAALCPC